jgi:hypothetical protein
MCNYLKHRCWYLYSLWTAWGRGRGLKKGKAILISISPTILPADPNSILPSEKLLLQHPLYLCKPVGETN